MPLHFGLSLEMFCPSHEAKSFSWSVIPFVRNVWIHPTKFCCKHRESVIWGTPDSFTLLNDVRLRNLKAIAPVIQLYHTHQSHCKKVNPSPFEMWATHEDSEASSSSITYRDLGNKSRKEEERRKKIGLANKGNVPWNKGRKHTEETRERIKKRTIEALRNPEVRKKMAEHPQPHSDDTKAKIRSSVKRVWAKRLRLKRSKEKFMTLWSENIAEAAKKGGRGQGELDWDSYERMKEEILSEQLQLAAEKARAKEQAKLNAEKAAQARAEKMKRRAEKKKEHEEKARTEGKSWKKTSGLKLKQRLTKIHKKKPKLERVAVKDRIDSVPKWEKLDLEVIKKERMVREFSLADQIQAAKSKRTVLYEHWPQT